MLPCFVQSYRPTETPRLPAPSKAFPTPGPRAAMGLAALSIFVFAPDRAAADEAEAVSDDYQRIEDEAAAEADGVGLAFPRVDGELVVEIQNDYNYDAPESDDEFNNLFTTTEADFNVFALKELPGLFVNLHLTLEEVNDNFNGDNRYFKSEGLFVENLSLNYQTDDWSVIGGKFGPNFSIAYDAAPGIYGTDVAEDDIEVAERIGVGGSYTLNAGAFGAHALSGSTFFLDNSILSNSVITKRNNIDREDGGPSNTQSFESFAIALDGAGIEPIPAFSYQVGFLHQAVDRVVDEDDVVLPSSETAGENRVVVAGQVPIGLSEIVGIDEDLTVTPLLEWVRFWNAEGVEDEDRNYLTASALVLYENWNLALATTQWWTDPKGDSTAHDYQFQVSAGYLFDLAAFGEAQLDVGWRYLDEDGGSFRTLGAMLTYVIDFGVP